jgi:hypothetical protein
VTARAFCAGAALAVVAALPARPAAQPAGKTGTPARLEFRALNDEGQPVGDLKAADLSLKVNGKPRTIQSLTLFRVSADAPVPISGAPLPPPYATNVAGEHGRVLYVLLDDDSISPGGETRIKDAFRMLTAELSPLDRVGVLSTQGAINVRPGGDVVKVRAAVDGMTGRAGTTETENDSKCRTKRVLAALGTMISVTAGTPTTLVVFSSGLSVPATKQVAVGSRSATGMSDLCPVEPTDFDNIGSLASTTAADVYLFQVVDGLAIHVPALDVGYESLAGVMHAELVRLQGNPQPGVSRLLRETAAYYTATFTADPGERNGQPLRVELKPVRDKLKLRTQAAIALPKEAVAKGAPTPKEMLRVAGEYRDLPLRATSYASRMAPGSEDVKVVALFESTDGALMTAASVGLFDEKGTLKKQWTATKDDLAKNLVRADLQASPGAYRVRVAAVDAAGRAGTADYDLRAETVRADPLKLSALVIGTQAAGAGFAPRLEFTSETVAIGLLEVYGVPAGAAVTVVLDVASSPEGASLATAETQIGKGSTDDARMAIGGFGIDSLPPGDYLMRAIVSLNGKPVGKVTRTMRKAK